MSTQSIIEKIIADATLEAEKIVRVAEEKAQSLIDGATKEAQKISQDTEEEVRLQTQSIRDKKSASDRLECAKIRLAEKRKALECVYKLALDSMLALNQEDTLKLASVLLEKYAEAGDTLVFAENYKYANEVAMLPVVKARKIQISSTRMPMDGGMRLIGECADKDLSYGALLEADKERYQAEIAKELFQE